ncbi:Probable membrane-associated kinase regulator 6 [Linum grandiflorum]
MESSSSESLAIESFSNSWLTNSTPSFLDSLDTSSPSVRPSFDGFHDFRESHKFCFDIPVSSSAVVAPADQLFSDGVIKPSSFTKSHTPPAGLLQNPSPTPQAQKRVVVATVNIQCQVFSRWRKLSTRVVMKCFRRVKCSFVVLRKSIRVDDVRRRALQVRSLSNSPPRRSTDVNYWSDMDSSIYEAVLHCKRSNR